MMNKQFKSLPLLFTVACLSLFYGLGVFYVQQRFDAIGIIFIILSIMCFAVFTLRSRSLSRRPLTNFNLRRTVVLVLIYVLSLALLTGINYLAFKSHWTKDVTNDQQHTLMPSTVKYISHLTQDISITVFFVGLPPKYLEDMLKAYEQFSGGRIKTEIVDPIVSIGYAAQFGNTISGKESKVFVRSGAEQRDVDFTDAMLSEEELTNAIIRTTRKAKKVYFLAGHGEADIANTKDTGFSAFAQRMLANNFTSQSLYLGNNKKVPEDCDVLVVAGPQQHLIKEEDQAIKDYLKNGGDALFLIENTVVTTPDKPLTEEQKTLNPSLNEILNDWGVNVADDVVVDLASYVGDDVGSPATRNYMPHKALIKDLDYTFYIRPRSISLTPTRPNPEIKAAPFVLTASTEKSWGETDRTLKVKYDEGIDRAGPVPISYVIWEPKGTTKRSDTHIIVFTDSDFLANAFVDKYSNAQMGLNVMNWVAEMDYQVFVDKKEVKISKLELTSQQKRMIAFMLFVMPLGIALAGIYVWLRKQ